MVEGKDDEGGREGGRERGYCHRNLMCEFVITRITHTVRVVCAACAQFNVAKLACSMYSCSMCIRRACA